MKNKTFWSSYQSEKDRMLSKLDIHYPVEISTKEFSTIPECPVEKEQWPMIFSSSLVTWITKINEPYGDRLEKKGVWYPNDYLETCQLEEPWLPLYSVTNPNFWEYIDIGGEDNDFRRYNTCKKNHTPTEALLAFFGGPTFIDCGMALQACSYGALLDTIGRGAFDALFTNDSYEFSITPSLYCPISSEIDRPNLSQKNRTYFGNPLYFCFDEIQGKSFSSEETIHPGDIIYMQGITSYWNKHLQGGFEGGWNLICVGENTEGEKLYLGFGPSNFSQGPLTYEQMRLIFVESYNKKQSITTQDIILTSQFQDHLSSLYKLYKNDTVEPDQPIGGIRKHLRFNPERLVRVLEEIFSNKLKFNLI